MRYPSNTTDAEWLLVEPPIPPAKRLGRSRTVNVREVVNAISHVLSTGCQWRARSKDFSPRSTVHEYPMLGNGTARSIASTMPSMAKRGNLREKRQAPPPQSSIARASRLQKEVGLAWSRSAATQEKIKKIKRYIVVDTLGMMLAGQIQPADVQDRDGALPLLQEARRLFPFVEKIFADGGDQGKATAAAVAALGHWELEIVKRSDKAKGFVVSPSTSKI